jgi:hypothetical protein
MRLSNLLSTNEPCQRCSEYTSWLLLGKKTIGVSTEVDMGADTTWVLPSKLCVDLFQAEN